MAGLIMLKHVIWQVFASTVSQARTIDVREANFTITSPSFPHDYPADSNVTWTIYHYSPANFTIFFTNFSLERSDDCKFDSLNLWNYIPAYPLLDPLCGNLSAQKRSAVFHLSYGFKVKFKSDSSAQSQGFALSVTTSPLPDGELCDYMHDHQARRLSSQIGKAGENYPSNLNCSWVISGYPDKQIVLHFFTLDVEYSGPDCLYDHIGIWDMEGQGNSHVDKFLAKVCGRHNPWSLFTNSSKIRISFFSDALDNTGEFVILYRLDEPLVYVPALTKTTDVTPVPQTESILADDINSDLQVVWKFRTQPGFRIQINVTRYSIVTRVSVYDGPDKSFRKFQVSQDQKTVMSTGFHLLVSVDLTASDVLLKDNFTFSSLFDPNINEPHTLPLPNHPKFYEQLFDVCVYYMNSNMCPSGNGFLQQVSNIGICAYGGLALYGDSLTFGDFIGTFCQIYPGYLESFLRRLVLPMGTLYVLYYNYGQADRSSQYFSSVLYKVSTHSPSACHRYTVKTHNQHQLYRTDHLILNASFTNRQYNVSIQYEEFPKDCVIIQLLPYFTPVKQINLVLKGDFSYRMCKRGSIQNLIGNVSNPVYSKYDFSKPCSESKVVNCGKTETTLSLNKHNWSLEYIIELGTGSSEQVATEIVDKCFLSNDKTLSLANNKEYWVVQSDGCSFQIGLPRGNVSTGYRARLEIYIISARGQIIEICEEDTKIGTKVVWSVSALRSISGVFRYQSMTNVNINVTVSIRDIDIKIQALKFSPLRPTLRSTPTNDSCALFEGHCYTFKRSDQRSWLSARTICHESGGDLISVNSYEELLFVKDALTSIWFSDFYGRDRGMIFIGLSDLTKANDYRWVDCSPLTVTDWYYPFDTDLTLPVSPMPPIDRYHIQPVADRSLRCVAMVPGNSDYSTNWRKVNCDLSTHSSSVFGICEFNNTLSHEGNQSKTTRNRNDAVKYRCEDGWNFVHDTCLNVLLVKSRLYSQAVERLCATYGGSLPRVEMIPRSGLQSLVQSKGFSIHRGVNSDIFVKMESGEMRCITVFGNSHLRTFNPDNCLLDLREQRQIVVCERDALEIKMECRPYQFLCNDGTCLTPDRICDLNKDCSHGEDESNCSRPDNLFTCDSGEQISAFKLCDFHVDCFDESDENLCVHNPCVAFQFECKNRQCIAIDQRCDQKLDCIDGSDEEDCDWQTDCKGFKCPLVGCVVNSHVQDLQPDCLDKSEADEKFALLGFSPRVCAGKEDQIPCHDDHIKCYPMDKACVYDHDIYGRLKYCSNGAHLRHCRQYECPDMFKCPDSYCIPHHKVCDGVQDCVRGEDETTCDDNTCPGMLKCGSTNQCVSQKNVCDLVVNCKDDWSDEMFCDLAYPSCPFNCTCVGYKVDCTGNQLQSLSDISIIKSVRVLDLRENNITFLSSIDFVYLTMFYLQHNNIRNLSSLTLQTLNNLILLDLSYNMIEFFPPEAFSGLSRLRTLMMVGNPVHHIAEDCFRHVISLRTLNLSGMVLEDLGPRRFESLKSLQALDLSKNRIRQLSSEAFASLPTLDVLFLHDNKLDIIPPDTLKQVDTQILRVDSFRFCCAAGKTAQTCLSPVADDASCADLLPTTIIRVVAWVFAILAILGNVSVISWRLYKRLSDVPSVFIFHLSVSDLLMGLYLLSISVVDLHYRDVYILHDLKWRASIYCKLSGVIGFISCEMSMYTLVFIAIDRTKKLAFPLSSGQFTVTHAWIIQLVGWGFWTLLSLSPLMIPAYFGDYYGRNSICLPFNFADDKGSGWEMTTAIFVGFNSIGLIAIIAMYGLIFTKVKESQKKSGRRDRIEVDIARKLSVVIVTDLACMLPIVLTNFISVLEQPIDRGMASILANLFLPLNSALNPFLFTLNNVNVPICKWNSKFQSAVTSKSSLQMS